MLPGNSSKAALEACFEPHRMRVSICAVHGRPALFSKSSPVFSIHGCSTLNCVVLTSSAMYRYELPYELQADPEPPHPSGSPPRLARITKQTSATSSTSSVSYSRYNDRPSVVPPSPGRRRGRPAAGLSAVVDRLGKVSTVEPANTKLL